MATLPDGSYSQTGKEIIENGIFRPCEDHEYFKYLLDRVPLDLDVIDKKTLEPIAEMNRMNDDAIRLDVGQASFIGAEALGVAGIPSVVDLDGSPADLNVYIDRSADVNQFIEINAKHRPGAANRYEFYIAKQIIPLSAGVDTSGYYSNITISCDGEYPLVYRMAFQPSKMVEKFKYTAFDDVDYTFFNVGYSIKEDVESLYYVTIDPTVNAFLLKVTIDLFIPHGTEDVAFQFTLSDTEDLLTRDVDLLHPPVGGMFLSGFAHRAAKIQKQSPRIIEAKIRALAGRVSLVSDDYTIQKTRVDRLEQTLGSPVDFTQYVDSYSDIPNPGIVGILYSVGDNKIIYKIDEDGKPVIWYEPGTQLQIDRIVALEAALAGETDSVVIKDIQAQLDIEKLEIQRLAGSTVRTIIITAADGSTSEVEVIKLSDNTYRNLDGTDYIIPANGALKPIDVPEDKFQALEATDDAQQLEIDELKKEVVALGGTIDGEVDPDDIPTPLEVGKVYTTNISHSENGKPLYLTRVVRDASETGKIFDNADWFQPYGTIPQVGSSDFYSRADGKTDVTIIFTYVDGFDAIPPEMEFVSLNPNEIVSQGLHGQNIKVRIIDKE